MAEIIGLNARTLIGNRNLSGTTNQVTLTLSAETPEVTSFVDNSRQRLAGGIRDFELTEDGFFETGASAADAFLAATLGASALAAAYMAGLAGSKYGYECAALLSRYEMPFRVGDAGGISLTLAGSSALYSLHSLSGSVLDAAGQPTLSGAGTSNLGSVDLKGAADTVGTSYATLRLLTLSGASPAFSASLQLSANDSAWTTAYTVLSLSPLSVADHSGSLVTFSSASRYARVAVDLAGTSPCATFFIACGSAQS